MNCARNYEHLLNFVKSILKISGFIFSGHGVMINFNLRSASSQLSVLGPLLLCVVHSVGTVSSSDQASSTAFKREIYMCISV